MELIEELWRAIDDIRARIMELELGTGGSRDDMMLVDECAKYLKLSKSRVYCLDIPRHRRGRRIWFLRSEDLNRN